MHNVRIIYFIYTAKSTCMQSVSTYKMNKIQNKQTNVPIVMQKSLSFVYIQNHESYPAQHIRLKGSK